MQKMSKSIGNGVDPQEMIDRYGADTVRLFSMFASPPDQSLEWNDAGVEGASRFIKRFYKSCFELIEGGLPADSSEKLTDKLNDKQRALRLKTHQTIKKVTDDMQRRYTFNTAIAAVMELMNDVNRFKPESDTDKAVVREAIKSATLMLAPVTPHVCHEIWNALQGDSDSGTVCPVVDASWPQVDESALVQDEIEMVVQVNGKLRSKITVPSDAAKDDCEAIAMADENARRHMEDKTVRKVIVVPGKLVNIVVS